MKVFRVKAGESVEAEIGGYLGTISAIHLDSYYVDKAGGGGKVFDWRQARRVKRQYPAVPVIVAGGLTAENVREAIATGRPDGVDVASGVEGKPGKKDMGKVKEFIEEICRVIPPRRSLEADASGHHPRRNIISDRKE